MAPYYGLRGAKLSIVIAFVAGTDFTLFGYDQGVTGSLLNLESFRRTFPEIDTIDHPLSSASRASSIQGIAVASYTLGCFLGAVATIWLGNILGRKRTVMVGSSIMLVGAVIQTASYSLTQLIVGRCITGIGNGMNTSTIPTWQAETAKPHHRGRMVMIEASLVIFGVMLSSYIDLGFSFVESSSISWHVLPSISSIRGRFPIAFQILMILFILATLPGLPESPRWLILKHHNAEAIQFLAALWDLPEDDLKIQDEFKAIQGATLEASESGILACFKLNRNRNFHRACLGYVLQVAQQLTGINIVTYYAATIYQNSIGLSPLVSRIMAAAGATEYLLANTISIFVIEKAGRRKLLLVGAVGQACSMAALSGLTAHPGTGTGIAATVFIFIYSSFFAIGFSGVPWLMPAEINPLSIRAPAAALATTGGWLFNFVIVMITPPAFNNIGYKSYIIFATINALLFPLVYFFYPETQGRSLEEIDEIFHSVNGFRGALDVVKASFNAPKRYGNDGQLLIRYNDTAESHELAGKMQLTENDGFGTKLKDKAGVQKIELAE